MGATALQLGRQALRPVLVVRQEDSSFVVKAGSDCRGVCRRREMKISPGLSIVSRGPAIVICDKRDGGVRFNVVYSAWLRCVARVDSCIRAVASASTRTSIVRWSSIELMAICTREFARGPSFFSARLIREADPRMQAAYRVA